MSRKWHKFENSTSFDSCRKQIFDRKTRTNIQTNSTPIEFIILIFQFWKGNWNSSNWKYFGQFLTINGCMNLPKQMHFNSFLSLNCIQNSFKFEKFRRDTLSSMFVLSYKNQSWWVDWNVNFLQQKLLGIKLYCIIFKFFDIRSNSLPMNVFIEKKKIFRKPTKVKNSQFKLN